MKPKEELAKTPETSLAVSDAELNEMFGGESVPPPIELAWPEIKLTKTSDFKLPDGTTVDELVGHIVFVKRSRAWWEADYDGNDNPPDCASDDCLRPNSDVAKMQAETCGEAGCARARWVKDDKGKNSMACSQSLNMIFLLDGMSVPRFLRIRSTSMGRKSPLAAFFTNALEPSFALSGKFQTVKVKLTLDETKINNFDTSILQVVKISTLESSDPLLPVLGKMFTEVEKEFIVVHRSEDAGTDDQGAPDAYDDDTPI